MDPERWQRIQDLFAAAMERPAQEREAFLDERCAGEPELAGEVASLLDSVSHADSFVEEAVRGGYELFDAKDSMTRIGKYEILEKIGQGGFGTVYKGRDPLLHRTVAVKTCTTGSSELRRRFFREGQIAANLQHPNVTTIHDFGLEDEVPYLVQEFLSGQDLNDLVAGTPLSTATKIDILVQIARGLEYAHGQGVLHRDVKPSNVRVLETGMVKIMDFGIARLMSGANTPLVTVGDTRLTGTGMTIGTVGYLAPEQLKASEVDARADMFSFGVLAYELFAGVRPFLGETFSQVSYQLLYERPPDLAKAWPECPDRRLVEVVERCLEKEAAQRYASMSVVARELEEVFDRLRSSEGSTLDPTLEMPRDARRPETLFDVPGSEELTQFEMSPVPQSTLVERPAPRSFWKRAGAPAVVLAALALASTVVWEVTRSTGGADPAIEPPAQPAVPPAQPAVPPAQPAVPPATPATASSGSPAPADSLSRQETDRLRSEETEGRPALNDPVKAEEPAEIEETVKAQETVPPPPAASEPPPPSPPPERRPADPPPPAVTSSTSAPKPTAAPPVEERPAPAGTPPVDEATAGRAAAERPAPEQTPRSAAEASGFRPMKPGAHIDPSDPGVVVPPEILEGVQPEYPRKARRRGRVAKVVVAVYVDEQGKVEQTIFTKEDDSGLGFNEAAEEAARKTRFRPGTRDGIPGKMWTEIPYDFSLNR